MDQEKASDTGGTAPSVPAEVLADGNPADGDQRGPARSIRAVEARTRSVPRKKTKSRRKSDSAKHRGAGASRSSRRTASREERAWLEQTPGDAIRMERRKIKKRVKLCRSRVAVLDKQLDAVAMDPMRACHSCGRPTWNYLCDDCRRQYCRVHDIPLEDFGLEW